MISFYGSQRLTPVGVNHFVYEKLDLDRREIRLCTLQPAAEGRPLSCSLTVVSLDSKPKYETLSYVWGNPSLSNEIRANGSVINITKNLHTALSHLRHPDAPRVIWADGICINQLDLDERSCQVRMMDDIYRKAKGVQIWLGETGDILKSAVYSAKPDFWSIEDTDKTFTRFLQSEQLLSALPPLATTEHSTLEPNIPGAIKILELLAAGLHLYQMPFFKVISPEAIEQCPVWIVSMRSLAAILSRPWWTRVWTLQEAMLSAEATVRIGKYQVPLSLFSNFHNSIKKHESSCCSAARALWHGSYDINMSLFRARTEIGGPLAFMNDGLEGRITLTRAFLVSCSRKASDPRDHVYALHGVLYSNDRLIKPSYELSTDKVFTNATRVMIEEVRSIEVLEYAIGVDSNNPHELPSWVCDWTRQTNLFISAPFSNASNGERFITKQTTHRILTVEACKVDFISATKDPTGHSLFEEGKLKEDVNRLEEWWSLLDMQNPKDSFAFWTTILLGSVVLGGKVRKILPNDLIKIAAWWELAMSAVKQGNRGSFLNTLDVDLIAINGLIRRSVREYKFWLTSQGFLGTGPRTLEKGDEVFVAKGSRVPLIFRPIENTVAQKYGISADDRGYLFVGLCYLHGFMDGEAVKPDTKWQTVHLC